MDTTTRKPVERSDTLFLRILSIASDLARKAREMRVLNEELKDEKLDKVTKETKTVEMEKLMGTGVSMHKDYLGLAVKAQELFTLASEELSEAAKLVNQIVPGMISQPVCYLKQASDGETVRKASSGIFARIGELNTKLAKKEITEEEHTRLVSEALKAS